MVLNKVGKIYMIDHDKEIGYIVGNDKVYMFTSIDSNFANLEKGDIVKFIPENVNGENIAFLVRKNESVLKIVKTDE